MGQQTRVRLRKTSFDLIVFTFFSMDYYFHMTNEHQPANSRPIFLLIILVDDRIMFDAIRTGDIFGGVLS